MKEQFLTLTALNFIQDGRLLGKGCAITREIPLERSLQSGAVLMGVFHPAQDEIQGKYVASMECGPQMPLALTRNRFLLEGKAAAASGKRMFRFG